MKSYKFLSPLYRKVGLGPMGQVEAKVQVNTSNQEEGYKIH